MPSNRTVATIKTDFSGNFISSIVFEEYISNIETQKIPKAKGVLNELMNVVKQGIQEITKINRDTILNMNPKLIIF